MHARGFTLIEGLVSLLLLSMVVIGFLTMFDTSVKVSKVQSAVAESQDSLRRTMSYVGRHVRMAGAGGLPAWEHLGSTPCAFAVDDNVSSSYPPLLGPIPGTTVVPIPGTDVVTLRGAFWGEIYDVDPSSYSFGSGTPQFAVPPTSNWTGREQRLAELQALLDQGPVLAVLASTSRRTAPIAAARSRWAQIYGAACLTSASGGVGSALIVQFSTAASAQCPPSFLAVNPNGVYPAGLENVARLALVQELTLFIATDPESGAPTLFMQEQPFARTSPIASDVVDLQVALGCDRDGDGDLHEDPMPANRTANADYWLFNNTDGGVESIAHVVGTDPAPLIASLARARLTLVARVPASQMGWQQFPIENENGRDVRTDDGYAGAAASSYRYRALTEELKLRSLGAVQ